MKRIAFCVECVNRVIKKKYSVFFPTMGLLGTCLDFIKFFSFYWWYVDFVPWRVWRICQNREQIIYLKPFQWNMIFFQSHPASTGTVEISHGDFKPENGVQKKIWNDLFLKASVDIYENWVCWNKWLHCGIMGKKKQVKLDHTFFLRVEWCVGPAHQHLPWTTGIRPVHRLPYLSPRWKRDSNRELVFLGPWSRVGQR